MEEAIQQARIQLREMFKAMLKKAPKGQSYTGNPTKRYQKISDEEVDDLLSEDENADEYADENAEENSSRRGSPELNGKYPGSGQAWADRFLAFAGGALNAVKKAKSIHDQPNVPIHRFTGVAALPRAGRVIAWR